VLIEPGDVFFHPDNPPLNYFRLSYSAISTDRIGPGIARLAAVIDEMKQAQSNI
jgi:GntR family transcriptional regulator/MocR family aminotransferase